MCSSGFESVVGAELSGELSSAGWEKTCNFHGVDSSGHQDKLVAGSSGARTVVKVG